MLDRNADVNEQTVTGLTALLLAAFKKHASIIKILLEKGANITFQGGENSNTALHFAVEKGDILSVNALLEHCKTKLTIDETNQFLHLKNKSGMTVLELAKHVCNDKRDDSNY